MQNWKIWKAQSPKCSHYCGDGSVHHPPPKIRQRQGRLTEQQTHIKQFQIPDPKFGLPYVAWLFYAVFWFSGVVGGFFPLPYSFGPACCRQCWWHSGDSGVVLCWEMVCQCDDERTDQFETVPFLGTNFPTLQRNMTTPVKAKLQFNNPLERVSTCLVQPAIHDHWHDPVAMVQIIYTTAKGFDAFDCARPRLPWISRNFVPQTLNDLFGRVANSIRCAFV